MFASFAADASPVDKRLDPDNPKRQLSPAACAFRESLFHAEAENFRCLEAKFQT